MIKLIAVIGNLAYLGWLIYAIYERGVPVKESKILGLVAVTVVVLCSLITILRRPKAGADENIIALWLKVKKADLKKQLKE